MDIVEMPFKVGEVIWYATAYSYAQHQVTCPVCFGNKHVKLTLGDGTEEWIECSACGMGYEGPRGFITEHGPTSMVCSDTIRGMSLNDTGWEVQTRHKHLPVDDVFRSQEEAEARRVVLHAAAEKEAEERKHYIIGSEKKKLAWHVSYHRKMVKTALRDLEHHEAKLAELGKPVVPRGSERDEIHRLRDKISNLVKLVCEVCGNTHDPTCTWLDLSPGNIISRAEFERLHPDRKEAG